MLICIEIPISDYNGESIYNQQMFFEVDDGLKLTMKYILNEVHKLHERDSKYDEYMGDWLRVQHSILGVKEWKYINHGVSSVNSFTDVGLINPSRIVIAPMTWKKIDVIR